MFEFGTFLTCVFLLGTARASIKLSVTIEYPENETEIIDPMNVDKTVRLTAKINGHGPSNLNSVVWTRNGRIMTATNETTSLTKPIYSQEAEMSTTVELNIQEMGYNNMADFEGTFVISVLNASNATMESKRVVFQPTRRSAGANNTMKAAIGLLAALAVVVAAIFIFGLLYRRAKRKYLLSNKIVPSITSDINDGQFSGLPTTYDAESPLTPPYEKPTRRSTAHDYQSPLQWHPSESQQSGPSVESGQSPPDVSTSDYLQMTSRISRQEPPDAACGTPVFESGSPSYLRVTGDTEETIQDPDAVTASGSCIVSSMSVKEDGLSPEYEIMQQYRGMSVVTKDVARIKRRSSADNMACAESRRSNSPDTSQVRHSNSPDTLQIRRKKISQDHQRLNSTMSEDRFQVKPPSVLKLACNLRLSTPALSKEVGSCKSPEYESVELWERRRRNEIARLKQDMDVVYPTSAEKASPFHLSPGENKEAPSIENSPQVNVYEDIEAARLQQSLFQFQVKAQSHCLPQPELGASPGTPHLYESIDMTKLSQGHPSDCQGASARPNNGEPSAQIHRSSTADQGSGYDSDGMTSPTYKSVTSCHQNRSGVSSHYEDASSFGSSPTSPDYELPSAVNRSITSLAHHEKMSDYATLTLPEHRTSTLQNTTGNCTESEVDPILLAATTVPSYNCHLVENEENSTSGDSCLTEDANTQEIHTEDSATTSCVRENTLHTVSPPKVATQPDAAAAAFFPSALRTFSESGVANHITRTEEAVEDDQAASATTLENSRNPADTSPAATSRFSGFYDNVGFQQPNDGAFSFLTQESPTLTMENIGASLEETITEPSVVSNIQMENTESQEVESAELDSTTGKEGNNCAEYIDSPAHSMLLTSSTDAEHTECSPANALYQRTTSHVDHACVESTYV